MSTVQFANDDIHPMTSNGGGVYATRQRTPSLPQSYHSQRGVSDQDSIADLEKSTVEDSDVKKKQVFSGWYLFWLAYQSTGVIYGDIGTSPLYVYSSTFSDNPSYQDLLGALSLIIWSITLMVSVKYVLIVLRADDEGEGGTFALYSLLSRYANIINRDPREELTVKMERVLTSEMRSSAKSARNFIERSRIAKVFLKVLGVFGVAMVMSDGVLTPAQSVLGAIQGIEVVSPGISNSTIVGASCGILILLFLIQPFGTTKLASAFAPIVIVWLMFNAVFGIYNLAKHDHSVLKAFSPFFAGEYLVRNGTDGWKALGGILLAFTGVEALFADLGAFSQRAISLSWLCFTYPCLLLGYIGQAAFISDDPTAWSNPFFKTVPPGTIWPSLIIAILAAVVASQAMITAVFQLLSQIMKLSYFPQIKTIHTSRIFHGQIYMPFANWLLMIGTVIVTAVYNNTTRLGHAYGVCVILVTFITTCMVTIVALVVWRLPLVVVIAGFLIFGALDGVFLSSALTKVPDGAWFTLALAIVLASTFILWRFGKEQQWRAEASDRFPLSRLLETGHSHAISGEKGEPTPRERSADLRLTPSFGGSPLSTIRGMGIFFDKAGAPSTTPTVFIHFLQKFLAAPEVIVFFHLRPIPSPSVSPEERYTIQRCVVKERHIAGETRHDEPLDNCFRVIIRHGYTDEVVTRDLGLLLFEKIRDYVIREGSIHSNRNHHGHRLHPIPPPSSTTAPDNHKNNLPMTEHEYSTTTSDNFSNEPTDYNTEVASVRKRLQTLQAAYDAQIVYIVGKEQMRVRSAPELVKGRFIGWHWLKWACRRIVMVAFLFIRDNTRSKIQSLDVEIERLLEVGFVKVV